MLEMFSLGKWSFFFIANCTHFCCCQSLLWIVLHQAINESNFFLCSEAWKNLFPFFSSAIWKPVVFVVWHANVLVFICVSEVKRNKGKMIKKFTSKAFFCHKAVKELDCLADISLWLLIPNSQRKFIQLSSRFPPTSFQPYTLSTERTFYIRT